jgi:hypothetical protein
MSQMIERAVVKPLEWVRVGVRRWIDATRQEA